MTLVAYYISWSKQQDKPARPAAKPATQAAPVAPVAASGAEPQPARSQLQDSGVPAVSPAMIAAARSSPE
jgi:uncharacterized membrane protein YebE (DUF533 family)